VVELFAKMNEYAWLIQLSGTVVGTVFMLLLGAVVWFYKRVEDKRDSEMATLAAGFKAVHEKANKDHEAIYTNLAALREAFTALRGEVHLVRNQLNVTAHGLTKIEGKIEALSDRLDKNNDRLAEANGKLVAVFRHIDARPRATDTQG
jgi:chromosome segregation ATPase